MINNDQQTKRIVTRCCTDTFKDGRNDHRAVADVALARLFDRQLDAHRRNTGTVWRVNEQALAEMHRWWTYDLQQLIERGWPAKPRIHVEILITKKHITKAHNLAVEWTPSGLLQRPPGVAQTWRFQALLRRALELAVVCR